MNMLAKTVMVLSIVYYGLDLSYLWIGQLFGLHNEVWETFGLPQQVGSPPMWKLLVGTGATIATLASLILAYASLWTILSGGTNQDFRLLAKSLRYLAFGLFGFWFGYNILVVGAVIMFAQGVGFQENMSIEIDPLDIEIVFLIISIVVFAVSKTLQRAWEAEEENQQFL